MAQMPPPPLPHAFPQSFEAGTHSFSFSSPQLHQPVQSFTYSPYDYQGAAHHPHPVLDRPQVLQSSRSRTRKRARSPDLTDPELDFEEKERMKDYINLSMLPLDLPLDEAGSFALTSPPTPAATTFVPLGTCQRPPKHRKMAHGSRCSLPLTQACASPLPQWRTTLSSAPSSTNTSASAMPPVTITPPTPGTSPVSAAVSSAVTSPPWPMIWEGSTDSAPQHSTTTQPLPAAVAHQVSPPDTIASEPDLRLWPRLKASEDSEWIELRVQDREDAEYKLLARINKVEAERLRAHMALIAGWAASGSTAPTALRQRV